MSVDLGVILQTLVIVGSAIALVLRMQQKMATLDLKVQAISDELKKLSEVTISLAKQDQRLLHCEEGIARLDKYLYETKISA